MELTINKEKVDLLVAAKRSYEDARERAIRALAVLCAAENGKFNAVTTARSENGDDGAHKIFDSDKRVFLKIAGLKGEPKPKGMVRGAVVNQRVLQPWAKEQIPEQALKNLIFGFAGALAAAIDPSPSETPSKPSPVKAVKKSEKAKKTVSDAEAKRLQAKYDADFQKARKTAKPRKVKAAKKSSKSGDGDRTHRPSA